VYALVILILWQEGDAKFEKLHLMLDTGNGILSLLLAVFLRSEQYNIDNHIRQYLVIGFGLAALTEIIHALVGIEWSGAFAWIQNYSQTLRPATWPPSTYVLPLSIVWLLYLQNRKVLLPPIIFAMGMVIITIVLFIVAWILPKYVDTGILGIQRPTQIPLLFLWGIIAIMCWRIRAKHPLYEGIVWMSIMLLLSDLCMLYSTSPHEKFTMMAHSGKIVSYTLLHIIQMQVAADDSRLRLFHENKLRVAAIVFESKEGMMVTDANGKILQVNHTFTDITGYSAEEIVGKNPRILKSGCQNATFYLEMWQKIHATGSWEGEIWNRRKNGEIYPERMTVTAVKNQDGIVTHCVATFNDITKQKAAESEIEYLAFYDALTELPNRRLLLNRLELALAASNRSGKKGALLFIDMDNFKTLNDTLGHDMGDLLLKQVANRLKFCVRDCDSVARFGGDEFVVMLEDLGEQVIEAAAQVEIIGNKILTSLNKPYQLAVHEYSATSSSIGVTLFDGHGQTTDELLKQADIAMYQAKANGRNTLRFFDPQMQESINTRVKLEKDLHIALAENQFELYYQVQTHCENQSIGAEVLIRWQHPERGLVSPLDFIPLAEETGLILPIGQWVLETACTQIKIWESNFDTEHLQLAVNVSAKQFHQDDFVMQIEELLQRSAINPDRLKLELTESLLLDNVEEIIIKMNALRKLGVHFSMDDFGTGYSSLAYLTRLPLNQLKIDQSFIRNLGTKPSDAMIVQTIIAMTKSLGMDIIAEGVETEAQRSFLELHGCPVYQGYLFSKPIPLKEFEALLLQQL
jgi:diguanylate cyclase (GGDEF)-like protein/PAS domain S-box-containing protein